MILKITDPATIRVKPKQSKKSFPQRLLKKIKSIILNKNYRLIESQCIYLDNYFNQSHFSDTSTINSYYGGGIIDIGTGNLIMGTLNLEAPDGKITIGSKTFIGGNTQVNSINSIVIGNNVLIAGNCIIQDHNSHSTNYQERRYDIDLAIARFKGVPSINKDFTLIKSNPVVIKDDAWIGQGSFILKGVTIGERAVIGAGSIVTKDVLPDSIVAGNPAKLIKFLIS